MSVAYAEGCSVFGALVKDSVSYATGASGADGGIGYATEPCGSVTCVSLTEGWTMSRNSLTETGVLVGSTVFDVIMTERSCGCLVVLVGIDPECVVSDRSVSVSDLGVCHDCETYTEVGVACLIAIRGIDFGKAALTDGCTLADVGISVIKVSVHTGPVLGEVTVGWLADAAPTGSRINVCSLDSCEVVVAS